MYWLILADQNMFLGGSNRIKVAAFLMSCEHLNGRPDQTSRHGRSLRTNCITRTRMDRWRRFGRSVTQEESYDMTSVSQTGAERMGEGGLASPGVTKQLDDHVRASPSRV